MSLAPTTAVPSSKSVFPSFGRVVIGLCWVGVLGAVTSLGR
jgi:hypothetical protein